MKDFILVGTLRIYYYSILISVGALAGLLFTFRRAKKAHMDLVFLLDSFPWIAFGGIVGARLWHILTPPPSMIAMGITTKYYLTHPLAVIDLRAGGFGIFGAVAGGFLLLWWFSWRRGQPLQRWLDILAPAILLAQAIGRWGNFFNQEVYGAPTSLPWGIFIDEANRLSGYLDQAFYHPIFFYESLWNLASVFMLIWLGRKYQDKLKDGDLFLAYLISYPLIRFLLDFLRLDAAVVAGVNINQVVMFLTMAVSGVVIFLRHRSGNQYSKPN